MPALQTEYAKSFDDPDEKRDFKGHGYLEILNFENDLTIGRGVFEPGWRWSRDVRPIAGTESCEASHTGYCLQGSIVIRMDDGQEFRIKAGDAFHIPPGHDAWVDGDETCVLLDIGGYSDYAKAKKAA